MEGFDRSSSNDLSSAPSSDAEGGPFATRPPSGQSNTIVVSRDALSASIANNATNAKSGASAPSAPSSATRQENAPAKQRRPRKKKEGDPNAPPAERKARKPRASAGTTGNARKKPKTEEEAPSTILLQHPAHTADLSASTLIQPAPFAPDVKPPAPHEAANITQNGFSNPSPAMSPQIPSPPLPRYQTPATTATQPAPPPPPPQRSRNIFDPVRGIERSSEQTPPAPYPSLNATPPRPPVQRTSASPAISSLINPPDKEPTPLIFQSRPQSTQPPRPTDEPVTSNGANRKMIDLEGPPPAHAQLKKPAAPEETGTDTETKPKRAKEKPPPMPIGSGLLNSTFFGGEASADKAELGKGVSVVLEIPLQRGENKVFNFARMAEEKYGFAAIYPRQAAQKERLAKVAAAGAALERSASGSKRGETSVGESGDEDLSVDIDRDSENDGDVNMTGMNGTNENSGTDAPVPRKRKPKRDEYDADDPFVDDSEMLWEAQAVASKDGFFVYMGPLVPEQERPSTEKTETTSKRGGRGRGRGGGPGSRGGRGGAAAAAAAAANGEGSGRGASGTSRGSGLTRKPRITKAERQQRELEKKQREQAGTALAAKPQISMPS